MPKLYLVILVFSISLIHAQFVSKPAVLEQINAFLQEDVDTVDSTYTVLEVIGKEKLSLNVNAVVEEFDGRYVVQLNSSSRKIKLQEESVLRNFVADDLKHVFGNDVFKSCQITRVGFEHQQRNGHSEIVGGVVMVHQLVHGHLVRGPAYIFMFYDALSNLKMIEYSWIQTEKKVVKNLARNTDVKQLHKSMLTQKMSEISESLTKENTRGELYKAVRSWRMMTDSIGINVLVPSITYLGKYDDAGTMRYVSFDIDEFPAKSEAFKPEICSKREEER